MKSLNIARQAELTHFLEGLKRQLPDLQQLLLEIQGHWSYEDLVYRFYHQSLKVYAIQAVTARMVAQLARISDRPMNNWFSKIITDGCVGEFQLTDNKIWLEKTRPQLEAFFHAKYMLEMAVKYGSLEAPPQKMPSGWAALLYLFNLR